MNLKPLRLLLVVGAALLPVAFVVTTDDEDRATVASIAPSSAPPASASIAAASPRRMPAASLDAPDGITAAAPIASYAPMAPAHDGEQSVRLSMTAPPFVETGSLHELVVGIAAPRRARWVDLTISADPNLLELVDATPSDWSGRGGGMPTFDARLGAGDNRIVIRAEAGGETSGTETAGVVIVRFEGVAPGSATLTVSGIAVSDLAGNAIPVASPSSEVQVEVMSGPI